MFGRLAGTRFRCWFGADVRVAVSRPRRHILAYRLKRLVNAGLLTRADVGPGRRAAYSLTEAPIQLVPVMAQLGDWGLLHRPTTKRLRVRAELGGRRAGELRGFPRSFADTASMAVQRPPMPLRAPTRPDHQVMLPD
jgi:hypothetical protein